MNTCCYVYMYVYNVHMNTYICVHYEKTQTWNMSILYIYKHISIDLLSGWVLLYLWRELLVDTVSCRATSEISLEIHIFFGGAPYRPFQSSNISQSGFGGGVKNSS